MLKRSLFLLMFAIAAISTVRAQDYTKNELYGTYSFLSTDVDVLEHEGFHGYGIGYQYNVSKGFGLVAEWTSNHGTVGPIQIPGRIILSVDARVNALLFGPRFSYRTRPVTLYAHYLLGSASSRVGYDNAPGIKNTEFAQAVGGGVDFNVTKSFAIRAGQFDYLAIHSDLPLNNGGSSWFRNFRYQAGAVFKF